MTEDHPNLALLRRLDPGNLAGAADLFAEDVVWHYFNPRLPNLQGDYVGLTGVQSFFQKLGELTEGTFQIEPVSLTDFGDELVVAYTKNKVSLEGQLLEIDVVTVWRIVGGRIAEVWDIPSAYTAHPQPYD